MKHRYLASILGALALSIAASPALASGDAEAGAGVFKKRCMACHSTEAGKNKTGPSLAGIIGKQAATADFAKYKGLKGSSVVWDEKNLDEFLANPKKFVGAKTMAYKLKKENERADVIAYLKSLQ